MKYQITKDLPERFKIAVSVNVMMLREVNW